MEISLHRIAQIINKGGKGDVASTRFDFALSVLILLNVMAVTLESVSTIGTRYSTEFMIFEMFSASVFLVEYGLRILTAPHYHRHHRESPTQSRFAYMTSLTGIIDLLAILPSLLQFCYQEQTFGGFGQFAWCDYSK